MLGSAGCEILAWLLLFTLPPLSSFEALVFAMQLYSGCYGMPQQALKVVKIPICAAFGYNPLA